MNRNKEKLIVSIIVLALSALACDVYSIAGSLLRETGCDIVGGDWIYTSRPDIIEPYCRDPAIGRQLNSQTAEEIQDEGDGQEAEGQPANEEQGESESSPNFATCNATQYLQITSEITRQETNQYNTRICEYTLVIHNTHASQAVSFMLYQHERDGYQGTESYDWMGGFSIAPGGQDVWTTNHLNIPSDPDAQGPVMITTEKYAGLISSPECDGYKKDDAFLEKIAVPLEVVCPME